MQTLSNKDYRILYFYNPQTNAFSHSETVAYIEEFDLPGNYTLKELPDIFWNQIAIYNHEHDDWYLIADKCYLYDEHGFFISEACNPLSAAGDQPIPANTEIAPLDSFEYPHWNGLIWQDKPIPENLYFPEFDGEQWYESGSKDDINQLIDEETNELIQQWCINNNKNECYYINCGIVDKRHPHYKDYTKARKRIILKQKQKKILTTDEIPSLNKDYSLLRYPYLALFFHKHI